MESTGPKTQPSMYALLWRAREVLLEAPAWLDYVRRVYAIDPGGHPFLSYVGLNFTSDTLKNYKFYFSFFKRLSPGEIADLLPVQNRGRFDEVYADWHPSQSYKALHRGTTFAVKVEPGGTLTHYYHLRLRGLPFGAPDRLEVRPVDRDNHHGICEEFTGSSVHLKRYYYLSHRATIAHSLEISGLEGVAGEAPSIGLLEYIESEGRDKMAWITGSPVLVGALVDQRGPPRLASGLAKIKNDCGFEMYGPGSARDKTDHSIYFIHNSGPLHPAGYLFDGVGRFMRRHLKLDFAPGR